MGQRLNIEIWKNGKALANCYYHWSAFSNTSSELAKIIIKNIQSVQENNDTLMAIKLLEATGAGLTDREIEYINKIPEIPSIEFKKTKGRNDGLIAVSEKEMQENRFWAEGSVFIYLDENRIKFDVFFKSSFEEWEVENEGIKAEDLESTEIDFDDIKFNKINEFCEFINNHLENDFISNACPDTVFSCIY